VSDHTIRPTFGAAALCISIALSSMGLVPSESASQTLGGEGGLGTLLQQLQTLQSQRALRSLPGSGDGAFDTSGRGFSGDPAAGVGSPTKLQQIQEKELIRQIEATKLQIITFYCQTGVVPVHSTESEMALILSPIERDFCRRAKEPLTQFGYQSFSTVNQPDASLNGAIQEDYILGIGDELAVTFRGQTQSTSYVRVDREGRVFVGELPPILAAGRAFGEFRRALERRISTSMPGTDVFLSLGSVHAISVLVAGEVGHPGLISLTSQSTVIDALSRAGGPQKTGSLRRIQVFRNDEIFWIDLYELLFGDGLSHNLSLSDGDRVVVPSIGATIAIGGHINRPGIYELPEGTTSASIRGLLRLAGGPIRPSGNIYSLASFDASGRESITEHFSSDAQTSDGDLIQVLLKQDVQLNNVELLGHVQVHGHRSLSTASTISALIGDGQILKDNPYMLFAALETTDPGTRARRLFPVNLQSIVSRNQDYALRDQDRLIVFSANDIQYLMSNDVQQVLQFGRAVQEVEEPGSPSRKFTSNVANNQNSATQSLGNPIQQALTGLGLAQLVVNDPSPSAENSTKKTHKSSRLGEFACRGLQRLATIVATTRSGRFANATRSIGLGGASPPVNPLPCPPIFDIFPTLLPFLLEHVVAVDGEVRYPGAYPVLDGTPLASLVAAVGGVTRDADLQNLELTRYSATTASGTSPSVRQVINIAAQGFAQVFINVGDVIRFNTNFTDRDAGPVLLSGEFVRPGLFDIRRGERLSEVITRAGGLTAQAYPYGAVFTRERVKRAQQAGFQRAARELNSAATFAAAKKGIDPRAVIALQEITRDLSSVEAVGRVVIEADPTVLQVRPEFDTVLEPGDKIFVPKRPNSILVIGDLLNPSALQFISGQSADKYIRQAGGFQQSADQDRVFIVYPNGVAQPVSVSVWNYNPSQVPPGSTIVVPKNPAPLDIFAFAKDIGALVSQLAITAASLAVIGDN